MSGVQLRGLEDRELGTGLWNVSKSHHSGVCPPEPAHQRALTLLPMDGEGMQGSSCASREQKRQRASGKTRADDDSFTAGGFSSVHSDAPLLDDVRSSGGHESAGDAGHKKMRKKNKRGTQSRDDILIFPRRKAGQDKLGSNRPPIVISRTVLESYFNMPQQQVCEQLVCFQPASMLHVFS
jgi:hypothetical protein